MRSSRKPVRKCHACRLNLGDACWLYDYPRGRWAGGRQCSGFENDVLYAEFAAWQKRPTVKTRKELRREFFRRKPRQAVRRTRRAKRCH